MQTPTDWQRTSDASRLALIRVREPLATRVAMAAAAWGVAFFLTVVLAPAIQRANFVFFWMAVLFAAWSVGVWAALAAAAGALMVVNWFLIEPRHQFGVLDSSDLLTFAVFAIASMIVSALTARLARAQRYTAEAAHELAELADRLQQQQIELEQQAEEAHATASEAEAARADAEAANRAKTEFLRTMSHELRTPLNAIAGYVDLLDLELRGPLTASQREDLARIRKSQRALLGLINDVLNLARIEAGQVQYELEDVSLDDALEEVEALVAPQLAARSLAYEFCRPAPDAHGRPLRARADRDKLQQIVLNLLSNAIKFTEPGGRVTLDCAATDGSVEVRVHDTGRGIPPNQVDAIFQPFVQVERGYTRTSEGTGLGLAISRDLARAMGGDLTVESRLGEGSLFTLRLPRA